MALARLAERWTQDAAGRAVLPSEDLEAVLSDRARWRAWALALEASVEWER